MRALPTAANGPCAVKTKRASLGNLLKWYRIISKLFGYRLVSVWPLSELRVENNWGIGWAGEKVYVDYRTFGPCMSNCLFALKAPPIPQGEPVVI